MYEFINVPLGKQYEGLDASPLFQPYSGVEITVNEDESIFVGDRTGRVLIIDNPWGTRQQALDILNSLIGTGFQYQPYSASQAFLNPAAEIGDGVVMNGLHSGIYALDRKFSPQMTAAIEAPQDEELDHEYHYEPKQERIFKREIAAARASIRINQDSIEAEVLRATEIEGTLSSLISQNATSINAKVSQTGGSNSSFGWSLLSSKFSLFAGNKEVFKCTAAGIEVNGKITATSGYIGDSSNGFTISARSIFNGMGNINSGASGIYIGTDGIALGGGKFKVTSAGAISAANMTLTGTLNIGGSTISASTLRSGAQSAYNNGGYWSGGGVAGTKFNNMAANTGAYPINASSFRVNGTQYSPRDITISDNYGTRTFRGVLMYSVG